MIDKGVIAETGTHDELIANNGVYKKLVLRQLNAGAVNAADLAMIRGDIQSESPQVTDGDIQSESPRVIDE